MNNKIRPDFLSALCILTFLGSTTMFLVYFLAALFFERTSKIIVKYSSWNSTETISPLYFTILMALFATSLIGAIRIWKLHRNGIYIYVFSQLTILLLPLIWIGNEAFSVTNAIFTAVFITCYALNWKWLK